MFSQLTFSLPLLAALLPCALGTPTDLFAIQSGSASLYNRTSGAVTCAGASIDDSSVAVSSSYANHCNETVLVLPANGGSVGVRVVVTDSNDFASGLNDITLSPKALEALQANSPGVGEGALVPVTWFFAEELGL